MDTKMNTKMNTKILKHMNIETYTNVPKILIELTICGKTEIKDEVSQDIYKKMNELLKKYTIYC